MMEEFEVGGVVKEIPCKHRFHGKCIEKCWGFMGLVLFVGIIYMLMRKMMGGRLTKRDITKKMQAYKNNLLI